jgi:hypothetical protein
MDVIGLDNREYKMKLTDKQPFKNETRPRSKGHKLCRNLLKEIYGMTVVLEEVTLPGTNGLKADFFLPQKRLIIEVCGQQHYKFIPYFHGNKDGFIRAKQNDQNKLDWAEINNFRVIELPDNLSVEEWKEIIECV